MRGLVKRCLQGQYIVPDLTGNYGIVTELG